VTLEFDHTALRKESTKKDYTYWNELLHYIENNIETLLDIYMTEYIPKTLPKNMAPIPKPSVEYILTSHKSMMNLI
jgi:hypothetical protein